MRKKLSKYRRLLAFLILKLASDNGTSHAALGILDELDNMAVTLEVPIEMGDLRHLLDGHVVQQAMATLYYRGDSARRRRHRTSAGSIGLENIDYRKVSWPMGTTGKSRKYGEKEENATLTE